MTDPTPERALAFFGLDASADLRELKRAYARLLKTTRPDDDVTAFITLQKNFEIAREFLLTAEALRFNLLPDSFEFDDEDEADLSFVPEAIRRSSEHDPARLHELFHRPNGPDNDGMRELVLALDAEGGIRGFELDEVVERHIAVHLGFTIKDLSHLWEPWEAQGFVRQRIGHHLQNNEGVQAAEELLEESSGTMGAGTGALAAATLARALFWSHPAISKRLEVQYNLAEFGETSPAVEFYDWMQWSRVKLETVLNEKLASESLRRILALLHSVPAAVLADSARQVLREVQAEPRRWISGLDSLKAIGLLGGFDDFTTAPLSLPSDDGNELESERQLRRMLGAGTEGSDAFTMVVKGARRLTVHCVVYFSIYICLSFSLDKEIIYVNMATYAVMLGVVNWILFTFSVDAKQRYRYLMRRRVLKALLQLSCHPEQVAKVMMNTKSLGRHRRTYAREFMNDETLQFLAQLALIARSDQSQTSESA